MPDNLSELYPFAHAVSREYGGVPVANLIEIYQLEQAFHARILQTASPDARRQQYHELYERVHVLKQRDSTNENTETDPKLYERLVLTFRRELENKSVLDVGCGNGMFLMQLAKLLPHGDLCGLDTSSLGATDAQLPFVFLQQDITTFTTPRRFDIVFSHQVFEHIAPADVPAHLGSVHAALNPGGRFIVCLPNRFWGPQDITRIVDNTFRGRIPAAGSHVNESSYSEMIPLLTSHGFAGVRTIVPFGAYISAARGIRVRPRLNMLLESSSMLRGFSNLFARHGRPVFKNPIMLVCEKA